MRINVRRLLLLLIGLGVFAAAGGGVIYWRLSDQQQARRAKEQIVVYLDDKNYEAAGQEADRLLLLAPKDGEAHYLKARTILADRPTFGIATTDAERITAIRLLLKATKLDPEQADAHKLLVTYFLSVGDVNEAANHAKGVLRQTPDDADAHFARACWRMEQSQPMTATTHVELLWEKDKPVRPRTAWLGAQLADYAGRRSDWNERVESVLKEYQASPTEWHAGLDLLGLIELAAWQARRSTDADARKEIVRSAAGPLGQLIDSDAFIEVPPRHILRAIDRLSTIGSLPVAITDMLESRVEKVFQKATSANTLDPAIHIHFANRLYARGKSTEAVEVIQQGIERSEKFGPQVRLMFAACDLWLAEYYLLARDSEAAQPHLAVMLGIDSFRPWAQLLTGYQAMMDGLLTEAAAALSEATTAMPKNGAAQALYGLCQLKRGLVSEGRALLEEGIRLGASEPRYQAWLALALAEAGYYDQAVVVARQLIADPVRQGLGRALLGQLKLRAGQLSDAERDFAEAIALTEPEFRPALRLSLAEIAAERGDWTAARKITSDLRATNLAPQAIAIELKGLRHEGKNEEAANLLQDARGKFPQSMLLLTLEIQQLVEQKRFEDAVAILRMQQKTDSQVLTPTLMLVEVHEAAGDPQGAIETLRQAANEHPEEPSIKLRLAEKLLASGKLDEAEGVVNKLQDVPHVRKSALAGLRARIAAEREDFAKAEEILTFASTEDPDNPMLRFLLGQLAARNGEYSSAAQLFEKSLTNGPLWNHASKALFHSLLYSGETDKAIDLVGQFSRRGKSTLGMRQRLIEVLARQDRGKDLDRALAELASAPLTERDDAVIVAILRSSGQIERALQFLEQALKHYPESTLLKEHKVALLIEQCHLNEAQQLLAPLLKESPKNPTLHAWQIEIMLRTKGEASQEQRMLDEALAAAKTGWEECPGDIVLASLYCQVLLKQGHEDQARRFLETAAREYTKLPDTDYMIARMHEANGNVQRAIQLLEESATHEADSLAARHLLRLESLLGRTDRLQETAESLLRRHPGDVHVLGMLAESAATRGDLQTAKQYLAQFPPSDQGGAIAAYVRAVLAFKEGNLKQAEQSLQRSLADPRQNLPASLLLARIRTEQNQHEEVVRLTDPLIRRMPDLPTPVLLAANSLTKLRRTKEAEALCRDFLQRSPGQRQVELALANVLIASAPATNEEAIDLAENALQDSTLSSSEKESWLLVLLKCGAISQARQFVVAQKQGNLTTETALAMGRAFFAASLFDDTCSLADRIFVREPENLQAKILKADATAQLAELATASKRQESFQKAATLYREVLKADRANIAAANNLAWTVGMRLKQPRQALDELAAHFPDAKNPRSNLPPDVLDTIGTLHLELDHLAEARSFLEAAVQKNPQSVSSFFYLGLVHTKQKRQPLAQQCFARVLELEPEGPWARQIKDSRLAN